MAQHPKSRRGVQATPEGIKLLKQAKAERGIDEGKYPYERIAEDAELSAKTVSRFFNGENVDRDLVD